MLCTWMENKKWITTNFDRNNNLTWGIVDNKTTGKPYLNKWENWRFPCNKSHASLKNLAGHWSQVDKSIENHYPSGDTDETQADDRSSTSKTCITCCHDGWLRSQICTKEIKVTWCKQTAMHWQGPYMLIKELTFHKFRTDLTLLFQFP